MANSITGSGALALVGMPGAGKTVCAEHLKPDGYFTLRFGAVVVDEVQRRGWEVNPANERIVREELRAQHGMAAMAVISLPKRRLLSSATRASSSTGFTASVNTGFCRINCIRRSCS